MQTPWRVDTIEIDSPLSDDDIERLAAAIENRETRLCGNPIRLRGALHVYGADSERWTQVWLWVMRKCVTVVTWQRDDPGDIVEYVRELVNTLKKE